MKKSILILVLVITAGAVFAQRKVTTSAKVTFDATTPKDALPKAENKTVIGSINTTTGEVAFEASVKNFSFSNPMMQEHFNGNNWFKSDQFPVFSYSGKIENLSAVDFGKDGIYPVSVSGDMKVRDVTKKEKIPGTVKIEGNKIAVAADFSLSLADYNITGAPVDAGKISKEPKVSVVAEF
jgi:polyisoprenoid-binding protein YceI